MCVAERKEGAREGGRRKDPRRLFTLLEFVNGDGSIALLIESLELSS